MVQGGEKSGYGFFVKETGESFYENKSGLTNNQGILEQAYNEGITL